MKKTVNNHYIPQHHLKQFLDKKGSLYTYPYPEYRTEPKGKSPKVTASRESFYSQETEDYLANIEDRGAKIAEKLRSKDEITKDEKVIFAEYIVSFLYRIPLTEQKSQAWYIERIRQYRNNYMLYHNKIGPIEYFQEMDRLESESIEHMRKAWEVVIRKKHVFICDKLLEREWWIAEIIPNSSDYFITSDNPLFFSTSNGMNDLSIQMTFPLSQRMALVFDGCMELQDNNNITYHEVCNLYHNQVNLINQRTADNSNQLYSPKKDIYVKSLVGHNVVNYHVIKRGI